MKQRSNVEDRKKKKEVSRPETKQHISAKCCRYLLGEASSPSR